MRPRRVFFSWRRAHASHAHINTFYIPRLLRVWMAEVTENLRWICICGVCVVCYVTHLECFTNATKTCFIARLARHFIYGIYKVIVIAAAEAQHRAHLVHPRWWAGEPFVPWRTTNQNENIHFISSAHTSSGRAQLNAPHAIGRFVFTFWHPRISIQADESHWCI